MLTSKQKTLKPLLESNEGLHLTAYLVHRGDLADLTIQLRKTIEQFHEFLSPVMTLEERNRFLEPLDSMVLDSGIFKQMKGNIGIFRNLDSFRVLNIPVEVEQTCQVATTFHVKPLLRWLQADQEFLLLGLEQESAHIYLGNQDSLKLIDSINFPELFKERGSFDRRLSLKKTRQMKVKEDETCAWLNEWVFQLTKNLKPKLFVAGESSLVDRLNRSLKYKNAVQNPISSFFKKDQANEICSSIRKVLKTESKEIIEKALMEFRFAEAGHRTRKNIFQITKVVVQGRVRKLIVSDELSIFGKIDKTSGGLAVHPCDLDHEDDDILDDLAQMVLRQGGEVIVASKIELPKGRPILAILYDEGKELEATEDYQQCEVLQERFG
ncbi:MAG: hypothetical protein ACK5P5_04340 [Pseudobdellovibrionaceae bacterium]